MCYFNPLFYAFRLVLAVALLILGFPLVHEGQPHYTRQYITVAGKRMSFTSYGLVNRRAGEPAIIFEAGFGASGAQDFTCLYPGLSKSMAGIGYDRNGELIRNNHNSFVMLLPRYPHGIHTQDPELVVTAIKRLLNSARAKGLK